jgi:putative transposase
MSGKPRTPIQVFDPKQDFAVVQRRLPHWSQAGTVAFVTWRTWDSIPENVYRAWVAEGKAWLIRHGVNPKRDDWEARLNRLGPTAVNEYRMLVSDRWNDSLDGCHGACVLKRPELAQIVADSLASFDGDRYELTDYVVMPNHVHLLAAFPDEDSMLPQCKSWKTFTATCLNRALGRSGRFWQQDGFDHLVRSLEQFEFYRRYIADNPGRAGLKGGEYLHWTREQALYRERI